MEKTLVIVESPAKAKTIARYLGSNYKMAASVGHIRDLPSSILGVDVNRDFAPTYIPMKGKNKVINELKSLSTKVDKVLIATDPDREGEAIAWHISTILKIDPASDCRIVFNEISEKAVKKAVDEPRPIDMNLVNSQQARRILDRLVGYELSPLLWSKIKKGLSAGRVQSVATKMIVDREQEISDFVPEEYWNLTGFFKKVDEKAGQEFKAQYMGLKKKAKVERVKIQNKEQMDELLADLKDKEYIVDLVKKGTKKRRPYAPYTTSTLQQDASRLLGFSSRRTMSLAQNLYEGIELPGMGQTALVTYIRTDSVRSSQDAVNEIRQIISDKFGEDYLPAKPKMYSNRNKSQDAHEAIRPVHFDITPQKAKRVLSFDQYRLYRLIWNRFMASQTADAVYNTLSVDIKAGDQLFRASGESIAFPGFTAVFEAYKDKDDSSSQTSKLGESDSSDGDSDLDNASESMNLSDETEDKESKDKENNKGKEDDGGEKNTQMPDLNEGEKLSLLKLDPVQKFTLPPPRYTEASLIKAMEEAGIGRPSTYAPTISTILDRLYIERENKSLLPTELGTVVTDMLKQGFDNIVDLKFTAEMESSLDKVEDGDIGWTQLLHSFYPGFHQQILDAKKSLEKVNMDKLIEDEKCPECGGDLYEKTGRYGKFIACGSYPECKYTRNMPSNLGVDCPLCGSSIVEMTSRKHKNRKFYVCDKQGSDPECPFINWDLPAKGKFCEVCGHYMVEKKFRRKSYLKCSNRDCPTNERKTKSTVDKDDKSDNEKLASEGSTSSKTANKKTASEKD